MNKAVFLDRDGVINFEPGHYTCSAADFIINDGIGESVKLLNDSGFLVIIISNQGGIAKSLYTHDDVLEMHIKLCEHLAGFHAKVDDFYYCPHHPDFTKCLCRKPGTLMFEKALAVYDIDPAQSFMIGDGDRDIIAAENCGIKGIKVAANINILGICQQIAGGSHG